MTETRKVPTRREREEYLFDEMPAEVRIVVRAFHGDLVAVHGERSGAVTK